jgi:hypothetical protein
VKKIIWERQETEEDKRQASAIYYRTNKIGRKSH